MMKKFVLALIISLCLVLPVSVNASELEKSFETSFDLPDFYGDIYTMTSYDDNGKLDGHIVYDYSNNSFFIKYNLKNELVYDKSGIEVNDLKVTRDENKILIQRINNDTGEIIWKREYNNAFDISKYYSYDNLGNLDGYLIMFKTESITNDINPGHYIMKYDLDGKLLWIKKNISYEDNYVKDSNGDWLKYNFLGSHGFFDYTVYNITRNLSGNIISAGKYWVPVLLINRNTYSNLVLIYNNYNEGILEFGKYTLLGDEISTKKFDISNSISFSVACNSKSIYGEYDGLILCSTNSENAILKFDYDGNLIWKHLLSYSTHDINESYDETGEFNGYIVTGYDDGNKKGYITKFTYPKKVIESKNSDVEVISDTYPGKTVTVKAKEKTGYVVKRIVVKDSSGKEIEVGSDGTFIMPDDDVSVEVVYEKKAENIITNPDTVSAIGAVLFLIMTIVSGTLMVKNNRKV